MNGLIRTVKRRRLEFETAVTNNRNGSELFVLFQGPMVGQFLVKEVTAGEMSKPIWSKNGTDV